MEENVLCLYTTHNAISSRMWYDCTSVCTMLLRCSRSLLTQAKGSTLPSLRALCSSVSITTNVPVLPTPALHNIAAQHNTIT